MIKDRNDEVGALEFINRLEYTEKKLNFIFGWFKSGFETPVSKILARKIVSDLEDQPIFNRIEHTLKNGNDGSIYYLTAKILPYADVGVIERLSGSLGPLIQKNSHFSIDLCCISLLMRLGKDEDWLMEWLLFKEKDCTARMQFIEKMKECLTKK